MFGQKPCDQRTTLTEGDFHNVSMVQWTDAERDTIAKLWSSINVAEIGPQALTR